MLVSLLLLLSLVACNQSNDSAKTSDGKENKNKDNTVTLYITRHGKTMLNTADRVQGWADSPLTEPGVEVAKNLGKGLKNIPFVTAYSSDSGRAIETANLILQNSGQKEITLTQDKNLREWNFGKFEGDLNENLWTSVATKLNKPSMEQITEELNTGKVGLDTAANTIAELDETNQAEDWKDISTRIKHEIDQISEKTAENGGGNVLIVSHGLTISALVEVIDNSKTKVGLENASITKVVYKNGKYKVESVNDMSYAEKGKEVR